MDEIRAGVVGGVLWMAVAAPAAAAQPAIEEIVVTGSYIKRESFYLASPITVIDQEMLKALATPALGEIVGGLPFSYGSNVFSNRYTARFQTGTLTQANFRGLGTNATLTLIDGKRAFNNLNNLLPQIAIERIDILKDGASALYGTEAVAGVLNVVTRRQYEGMQVSGMFQSDSRGDSDEYVLDLIGGKAFDWGHVTLAAEYRDRGRLDQVDRGRYLRDGFSSSNDGNPGSYRVPVRNAQGRISGFEALRDPGCGVAASPGGNGGTKSESLANRSNNISGTPAFSGPNPICQFQFGEYFQFVEGQQSWNLWSNIEYRLTDSLTFEASLTYNHQDVTATQAPTGPGGRFAELGPVTGEHPGNPFRAYADLDGDGRIDDGERLFAQDADGDGVPDRDAGNAVILAADPFDPSAGIAFNEDVTITGLRLYGKLGTLPSGLATNSGSRVGPTFEDVRTQGTLSWDIDGNWAAELNVFYTTSEIKASGNIESFSATDLGLRGQFEADDGTQLWYNPFSSVALTCTDRVCVDDPRGAFENSQAIADAMVRPGHSITDVDVWQTRVLIVGDLPWQFPAGAAVGSAWGAEFTSIDRKENLSSTVNNCDGWFRQCAFDWNAEEESWSVFGELVLPVFQAHDLLGNVELQLAARYAHVKDSDEDFVPKAALLWQPRPWLSLRGSYSQAFIAPSIPQRFAPSTQGAATTTDPLFFDAQATFKASTFESNPGLDSETADVWNVGVSFLFFDETLGIGADYAVYDFKDRISRTTAQQVIDRDFAAFQQAFPNPTPADRFQWGCGGLADAAIVRPQCDLGITTISDVRTSWINAQKMKHKALDLYATYQRELGQWGTISLRVDATYVDEYSYFLGPGFPAGDGVGQQNDTIAEVPPIPEWRLSGSVNLTTGNQNVRLGARWSDEVALDAAFFGNSVATGAPFDVCPEGSLGGLGEGCEIQSLLYIDLSYRYRWDHLWGDRSTAVEIGGHNITDELPKPLWYLSGIETYLHDPRGALWYLRLTQDL